MRVALVCPYDWAKPGGVRAHVANLADYLVRNHDVTVLSPVSKAGGGWREPPDLHGGEAPAPFAPAVDASDADPADGYPVISVARPVAVPFNRSIAPVGLSPIAVRRTVRALETAEADVVHVHEPFAPMVAAAATLFGPQPIVGTFHTWSDSARLYRGIAPVARRASGRLAARIAVSPAAQAYAAGALGLPLGGFRVIPNGVNYDAFAEAEPLPELQDPERPLVLFVGRLEPRKGLDVAIRAFLRLRSQLPRVRLCVVGEGPERERCQRMVPPSLRPDVLFVGSVQHRDLPRYHASADVFVSPATGGESFGIVLLEAMAAGLPVVASDIPGYRTVMREGRQGRLVPPGEAFALSDAVGTLLANDRLRAAMGAAGKETAASYAWPVVGARIEEVYASVTP